MPYIPQEDRCELLETHRPETTGQLNYLLTTVISNYFDRRQTYAAINDVLGALEGAKLEFYRRVAAPYEDFKRQANGDVY